MADEKNVPPSGIGLAVGGTWPPKLAPELTEDAIARAVAKGLGDASAKTREDLLRQISAQLDALLRTIPTPPGTDTVMWEEFFSGQAVAVNRIGIVRTRDS